MRNGVLYGLLLALIPTVGSAGAVLENVKKGVTTVTTTVTDTVGGAVNAVNDTVVSANESLRDEATPEQTRAKLDEMAEKTLARLFEEKPESRPLFDRSAGYAVFDAREASFYVAAGYGRGVAVDRESDAHTYMKMATTGAKLSLGIGGFERQLVFLFETVDDLQHFQTHGADATAEAGAMMGEEKEELALRFNNGKVMFMLTKGGWKIAAGLTGTRYWSDVELNQP